jgi:hypothetical protein
MLLAAAASKIHYIVLIAYCSLPAHGECGLAAGHTTYKTLVGCKKAVVLLDKHTLEGVIGNDVNSQPPWDVAVKCGTQLQADQIVAALKAWHPTQAEDNPPKHPGESDPYPNGG